MVLPLPSDGYRAAMGQENRGQWTTPSFGLQHLKSCRKGPGIILEPCSDLNITISLKKWELREEITFAGHIVSQASIRPDNGKYKAIVEFPTPTNVSQLRSFLGLANQLTAFIFIY